MSCVCFCPPQKVTYRTKRPLYDLRTIAEVEGAGVKAGKHAEWREQIIVPPLPQSALACCGLIEVDYFIQVRDTGSFSIYNVFIHSHILFVYVYEFIVIILYILLSFLLCLIMREWFIFIINSLIEFVFYLLSTF